MEEESRKFKNWHKRKLCRLSGTPETDSVSSPVVEARQLDSGTPDNSQYWHPPQYQPLTLSDTHLTTNPSFTWTLHVILGIGMGIK